MRNRFFEETLNKYKRAGMSGKLVKIAVLIPCYNESTTIEKVVGDVRATFPEADIICL